MMACPSSKTSLVQANPHYSETASAQSRKWLEVQRTAIALSQEPWVGAGKIKGLNNLKGKLFYTSEHNKPRACIYTTKDICAQPLTDFCSRDMYAVAIQYTQERRLVVASVYMPEEDTPPPHDLGRLVNFCERTGLEVVIGTDSNAHHTLWGMEKPNERAKQNTSGSLSLKKPDGSYSTSPDEAQRILIETHFPWAIHSFLPYKAARPDGIFPALLQWGGKALIIRLVAIMRAGLALKYVPRGWREVKVIFIPKPGKSDYTDPKSYRPISLTSFLLKTMERMCERELRGSALMNLPLHDKQHAYCLGKSTESAIHQVITKIEEAIQNKEICLGSFIDIEGAFDRTNFSSIKGALSRHKVEPALIDWIVHMHSTRII
ncbi:unnamed protein product [Parnassius mnemosyne]|uniref:Reverse transcriptase domain-containing protein n=1 Tax=Parnassius mnemosyne TaxID=213953 RepID=A0AAV1KQM3_9NEOP